MVKKNFVFIGIIAVFLISINLACVFADGGYFPKPGYWVRPGQQKAIVFHEGNVETLIITSNFQGNAKDLAWIIPTPTRPEVTKANEKVFTNVAKLAQQRYSYGYGLEAMSMGMKATEDLGVVVIESKQVDYYDVNVLLATSSADLVEWFNENNYTYPEEYAYVLNYYIQKGWYFTAVKISPEAQGATEVMQDLKEGHATPVKMVFLSEKIVFPLKISAVEFGDGFKISTNLELTSAAVSNLKEIGYADLAEKTSAVKVFNQIIADVLSDAAYKDSIASNYSLIISSSEYIDRLATDYCDYDSCARSNLEYLFRSYFSENGIYLGQQDYYGGYTPIQLYVIADAKYEADEFYVQYGNWVKKSQIEDLGEDENGKPFISPSGKKYFLTSLSANMQKSQMDDDVVLKKADDNKKVSAGPETWQMFLYGLIIGVILFVVWIFTPLGIMFIAGSLILFLSRNKVARIFGWIMEILALALTVIVEIVVLVLVLMSSFNYVTNSILITGLILIAIVVVVIVLEIKHKKRK